MAHTINRLTDITIRKASKPGMYCDGAGLYLRIAFGGSKSWIYRYWRNGKMHDVGLGPLLAVSLPVARQRAQKCREQRFVEGIDPLAAKRASKLTEKLEAAKAMSFEACAKAYIAAHQAGWRNAKHAAQWPSSLSTFIYPVFGRLPVAAIDVGLVMKAIEPIWTSKTETASRLRGRIEAVLDWATTRGYRQGENPARWKGHLENLLPRRSKVAPVKHHAALPYAEIGAFMAELRAQEGIAARALEFAILTVGRVGEIAGATWGEVNRKERLWTIPADRMKAHREHRVPLSDAAMAIIDEMASLKHPDRVFPRASSETMLTVLRDLRPGNATIHGFRSTFRDWAAECTSFPADAAEMALAHRVSDKVEASYRRGDMLKKRYQLAEAWARFCQTKTQDVVVPLRAAAD